jgi:hypothetical protein
MFSALNVAARNPALFAIADVVCEGMVIGQGDLAAGGDFQDIDIHGSAS